ncbi:hypothetical protein HLQ16_23155 [Clostridium estertheticum]|uniref:Chemotaxis methyl-accepting receptor HlyB-like 4HB MCP domain-containing protein n=1 Tax=Clostridium estertheticum TaxID=238834 RepID=A0A7Y3WU10_9CLOT|nr:hypothetical protein [Clostridium estertheticum]
MLHLTDKNEIAVNAKTIQSLTFENSKLIRQYKTTKLVSGKKALLESYQTNNEKFTNTRDNIVNLITLNRQEEAAYLFKQIEAARNISLKNLDSMISLNKSLAQEVNNKSHKTFLYIAKIW